MTPQELSTFSMSRLCDLLEMTGSGKGLASKEMATVRGWIMDAMEAKNPKGFDAWLMSDDSDDSDAKKYLLQL